MAQKISFKKIVFRIIPRLLSWKHEPRVRSQWMTYWYMKRFLKYANDSTITAKGGNSKIKKNGTIWLYWRQGEISSPRIVKQCISSVRRNSDDYNVIVLDDNSLCDYIKMPSFLVERRDKGYITEAQFSDLVRISLLIEYGGVWCDATCFFSNPIPSYIKQSPLFFFQNSKLKEWTSPIRCSNWFIKADCQNEMLIKLRNVLFNYYRYEKEPPIYLIFHVTLSLMVDTIPELLEMWEGMPYICNMNPHVLQFSLGKKYEHESFSHILSSCFVHKLTYKYNKELIENNEDNNLQHILNL